MLIEKYSKTNIKVRLLCGRYLIYYVSPDDKQIAKIFGTSDKAEMIEVWTFARKMFMKFGHASYWESEKKLLNNDNSLFKKYIEYVQRSEFEKKIYNK